MPWKHPNTCRPLSSTCSAATCTVCCSWRPLQVATTVPSWPAFQSWSGRCPPPDTSGTVGWFSSLYLRGNSCLQVIIIPFQKLQAWESGHVEKNQTQLGPVSELICVPAGPPFSWTASLYCKAGRYQTRPLLRPWCPPCFWRTAHHAKPWLTSCWPGKPLSISSSTSHSMVLKSLWHLPTCCVII